MGGSSGRSGLSDWVGEAGGQSGWVEQAVEEGGQTWSQVVHLAFRPFDHMIRPFENRPFYFRPKIQLGLLEIWLYAVQPNLSYLSLLSIGLLL